jgi:hypothetical protein
MFSEVGVVQIALRQCVHDLLKVRLQERSNVNGGRIKAALSESAVDRPE